MEAGMDRVDRTRLLVGLSLGLLILLELAVLASAVGERLMVNLRVGRELPSRAGSSASFARICRQTGLPGVAGFAFARICRDGPSRGRWLRVCPHLPTGDPSRPPSVDDS